MADHADCAVSKGGADKACSSGGFGLIVVVETIVHSKRL